MEALCLISLFYRYNGILGSSKIEIDVKRCDIMDNELFIEKYLQIIWGEQVADIIKSTKKKVNWEKCLFIVKDALGLIWRMIIVII
jgi:citrate lyase gamma subunit